MAANVPVAAGNGSNAPLRRRSLGRGKGRVQGLAKMGLPLALRVYKKGLFPISRAID
jgi:hypothetical protein